MAPSVVVTPRAGLDFPASEDQLRSWFPDDAACLDYLDWLRWPAGFRCPACASRRGWRLPDGRRACAGCGRRASPTAGTVLHRTRTPLPLWFVAAWDLTGRGGTTAVALQRRLGLGSYQTAWAMLHRYRTAMAPTADDRLAGVVDLGGLRLGAPGPPPCGGRSGGRGGPLVLVAVERPPGGGLGRRRLRAVADGRERRAAAFLAATVEPGAELHVDPGRPGLAAAASVVPPVVLPAAAPPSGPAQVAAHAACWLRTTLQGAIDVRHLQAYLDEYGFLGDVDGSHGVRFHRLLVRAVAARPTRSRDLVAVPAPGRPTPPVRDGRRRTPSRRGGGPPVDRPWRRR